MNETEIKIIRAALERLEEIGIQFVGTFPAAGGMMGVSIEEIEKILRSTAKFPYEHEMLGLSDEEVDKYLRWKRAGQPCLGKTKRGTPCKMRDFGCYGEDSSDFSDSIRNFEKWAFCRKHEPNYEFLKKDPSARVISLPPVVLPGAGQVH